MGKGCSWGPVGRNPERKEVMDVEQVILQVLRDVGIYERVREKVNNDAELARLFDQDFEKLVEQVQK